VKQILLLCLALLNGCATTGQNVVENLPSVPPDRGLVLFSTGAATTNLSSSTGLTLVEGVSLKKYDKVAISIDYPFSSHLPNEHGHVRTLALTGGDYFLLPRSGNPYFVLTKAPVYKFRVTNGQITHIGNFYLSGNSLSWSGSTYNRDVDYFLQRNPKLSGNRIDSQRAEVVSDVSQFKIQGIIWDVP